jgi:hypothetical protein
MRRSRASFAVAFVFAALSNAHWACAQGPQAIDHCQTIDQPGSYVLVKPIGLGGVPVPFPLKHDDCLVIANDFVTIDLAGFPITGRGPGAPVGAGIADDGAFPRRAIAVRNGTISGFSSGLGISFNNAPGAIVEEVRAVGNHVGIAVVGSGGGIVRNSIAVDNVDGIEVFRGAMIGNIAAHNRGIGIIPEESSAIDNTAIDNDIGIFVTCPSNLIGNTAIINRTANIRPPSRTGCNANENLAP